MVDRCPTASGPVKLMLQKVSDPAASYGNYQVKCLTTSILR